MLQIRHMMRNGWRRYGFGALAVAVGAAFLLLYSSTTSPLSSNYYGQDSAFFQYVGSAASRGVVMYRDVLDTKGPYLFAIQQLAYLAGGEKGRWVLFAIQLVCMAVSLLSLDASCRLVLKSETGKKNGGMLFWRSITLLAACYLLSYTLQFGNLTEEYSLPVLCFCQYLMLRYRMGGLQRHPVGYGAVYGFGFGVLALIRLTNACLLCCIVFCIVEDLIVGKQYRNLLLNMAGFIGGVLFAAIPILAYYQSVGAIAELWDAVFVFAYAYAVGGTRVLNLALFLPLAMLGAWAAVVSRNWFLRLYAITAVVSHFFICRLGYGNPHYYQLMIPPTLACLWMVARWIDGLGKGKFRSIAGAAAVLMILLPNGKNCALDTGRVLYRVCANTHAPADSLRGRIVSFADGLGVGGKDVYGEQPRVDALAVLREIPPEDRKSVYCTTPRWSLLTQVDSCSRYCETPEIFASISPKIDAELGTMFAENPPAYVVESAVEPCFPQLPELGYRLKLQTDAFLLYEYIR